MTQWMLLLLLLISLSMHPLHAQSDVSKDMMALGSTASNIYFDKTGSTTAHTKGFHDSFASHSLSQQPTLSVV